MVDRSYLEFRSDLGLDASSAWKRASRSTIDPTLNSSVKRLNRDQADFDCMLNEFRCCADPQHVHQMIFVRFCGSGRDVQLGCDFLHGFPLGHELEHFALAPGELWASVRRWPTGGLCKNRDQVAGELRAQVVSAALHNLESFLQFVALGGLEDECRCPRTEHQYSEAHIHVHRQNDELAAQSHGCEALDGVEAIQQRHRQISQDQVWLE